MKKNLLKAGAIAAIVIGAFSIHSCSKIKDAVANSVNTDLSLPMADVTLTVLPISDTTNQVSFGTDSVHFGVDTFISNHTGGLLHLSNITSAKVIASHMQLVGDPYTHFSNFANFESAQVALNTNTFNVAGNQNIPDVAANYIDLNVDSSANLIPVLQSSVYTYYLNGKLRRATLDTMQIKVHLEMKIHVQ